MEAQRRARGDAYFAVWDRSQDKGTRRGTKTVDHHGLARKVQALKLADVLPDLTAPVTRYADCCVTGTHIRNGGFTGCPRIHGQAFLAAIATQLRHCGGAGRVTGSGRPHTPDG
jgi:hypothetical protein